MNENQKKGRKQIATEYFASNFNCAQAVFTTFAVEEGIPEDMAKIRELGLFQSICPEMICCATEIVEEMLKEL